MNKENKFKEKLTMEDIKVEIDKVGAFFKQIPEELRADAADNFIFEIVNWAAHDHYQALGIFQEAMFRYREVSLDVFAKEEYSNRLKAAYEISKNYRCLKSLDWMENPIAEEGDICRIGYFGEDENYSGGKKYIVFRDEESIFVDICQNAIDEYFELVE